MKKKLLGLILITLSFITIGCGNNSKRPEGMSKEAYSLGNQAIEISQTYVDGDKTSASTYQALSDIYDDNEKLLTKESETYDYDFLVSSEINIMMSHVLSDQPFDVIGDIDNMKDLLTPIEDMKLSDVIVGTWTFEHENGGTLKITFESDGSGTCQVIDNGNGGSGNPFEFDYSTDDDDNSINSEYDDGSGSIWFTVTSVTNKSMNYIMYEPSGRESFSGVAYKE